MIIFLFFPIFIGKGFYGPRYGRAREIARALRLHRQEGVGELLRHAAQETRMGLRKVVGLGNVATTIVETEMTTLPEIDEVVVATEQRGICPEAVGFLIAPNPDIGEMEKEGARVMTTGMEEEWGEVDPVDGLHRAVVANACHGKECGVEVLDDDAVGVDTAPTGDSGPENHHGFVDATLESRTLASPGRVVLVEVLASLTEIDTLSAIVGHEEEDGVACHIGMELEIVEDVAKTLVHAFDKCRMIDLLFVERHSQHGVDDTATRGIAVVGGETRVGIVGNVDGIVGEIEEEGLAPRHRLLHLPDGFEGECLGEEGATAVVALESRDMEGTTAVFVLGKVTGWRPVGSPRNVDAEPEAKGIGTRRLFGSKMCLAAVDGVVAVVLENLRQGSDASGVDEIVGRGVLWLYAVVVPGGQEERGGGFVGGLVVVERPVGDTMACRIHAGEEGTARGGGDGTGIGIGEAYAEACHAFHVRCAIALVEGRGTVPEGYGGLLPPHVIDEE